MHYPDAGESPVFHSIEVESFYTMIGCYYAINKQIAHAIKCYFIVEKSNPKSPYLNMLSQEILMVETAALLVSNFEVFKNAM